MGTGKCWTLKDSKEDEQTPGPIYQTQYLGSITHSVNSTFERKQGTFGAERHKRYPVPYKGMEDEFMGKESPGPQLYTIEPRLLNQTTSMTRSSQKFSIPLEARFKENSRERDIPSPTAYSNTNTLSKKMVLRNPGNFSIPKQKRKIDFAKFSSLHKELV